MFFLRAFHVTPLRYSRRSAGLTGEIIVAFLFGVMRCVRYLLVNFRDWLRVSVIVLLG
jgi:hypothetical protein